MWVFLNKITFVGKLVEDDGATIFLIYYLDSLIVTK